MGDSKFWDSSRHLQCMRSEEPQRVGIKTVFSLPCEQELLNCRLILERNSVVVEEGSRLEPGMTRTSSPELGDATGHGRLAQLISVASAVAPVQETAITDNVSALPPPSSNQQYADDASHPNALMSIEETVETESTAPIRISNSSVAISGQEENIVVEVPMDNDVLFGKRVADSYHSGTRMFRKEGETLVNEFLKDPSADNKKVLAERLLQIIYSKNGRFLEQDEAGNWRTTSHKKALDKARQLFTDAKKKITSKKKSETPAATPATTTTTTATVLEKIPSGESMETSSPGAAALEYTDSYVRDNKKRKRTGLVPNSMLSTSSLLIGRTDTLDQLTKTLKDSGTIAALVGGAGVGKSATSKKFATNWVDHAPEDRFALCLDASSEHSLKLSYVEALQRLDISISSSTADASTKDLANLLWEQLARVHQEVAWLVVFDGISEMIDNVEGPVGFKPFFFPTPLKNWSRGRILLTTRSRLYAGNTCLGYITKVEVKPLPLDDAVEMFVANAGLPHLDESTQLVTKTFVASLHGLPLAIEAAASEMNNSGRTVKQFVKKNDLEKVYETIGQALESSFDHIRQLGLSDVLSVAAFVKPDRIQAQLLCMDGDDSAVRRLSRLSLLRIVEEGVYCMHPLHQAAARRGRTNDLAVAEVSRALTSFDVHDQATWALARDMLPHVDVLVPDLKIVELGGNRWKDSVILCKSAASVETWVLHEHSSAKRRFDTVLTVLRQSKAGQEHPFWIAQTLSGMGRSLYSMGDYEDARLKQVEALATARRTGGDDKNNKVIAWTLHNLGSVYVRQCQYDRAKAIFEEASVERHKAFVEGTKEEVCFRAATYSKLGRICLEERDFNSATNYLTDSLGLLYNAYGEQARNVEIARVATILGEIHQEKGMWEDARIRYEEALNIYWDSFGADASNDAVALVHCHLGSILVDLDDLVTAETELNKAKQMMVAIYGQDRKHDNIARVNGNLGLLNIKRGQTLQGTTLLNEARTMLTEVLGAQACTSNLARRIGLLSAKKEGLVQGLPVTESDVPLEGRAVEIP